MAGTPEGIKAAGPALDEAAGRFLAELEATEPTQTPRRPAPKQDEAPDPAPDETPDEVPEDDIADPAPNAVPEGDELEASALEADEPRYRVKVDGAEYEVTEQELLSGYSRTQDYTRKTQAVAEQRKAAEAATFQAEQRAAEYAGKMQQLETALRAMAPQEPDWATLRATETPDVFAARYAEWQIQRDQLRTVEAERQRAEGVVKDDQARKRTAYLAEQEAKLLEKVPAWKNTTTRQKESAAMRAFALAEGYDETEIANLSDARTMVLLRRAWQDSLRETASPTIRAEIDRIKTRTPTATPGSAHTPRKPVSERVKIIQRAAKSGKVEDAARAFEHFID